MSDQDNLSQGVSGGFEYEDRIVVFLDVLGWKYEVDKSVEQDYAGKLGKVAKGISEISEFFDTQECSRFFKDYRRTQFSDSVVLSFPGNARGIESAMMVSFYIFREVYEKGMFIRGGIAKGKLYHSENIVYGPGLVEAYKLESEFAVYPRLVISSEIAKDLLEKVYKCEGCKGDYSKRICEGDDGIFYLNIFFYLCKRPDTVDIDPSVLGLLGDRIKTNIERFKDSPKVKMKYVWLASYFNKFVRSNTPSSSLLIKI